MAEISPPSQSELLRGIAAVDDADKPPTVESRAPSGSSRGPGPLLRPGEGQARRPRRRTGRHPLRAVPLPRQAAASRRGRLQSAPLTPRAQRRSRQRRAGLPQPWSERGHTSTLTSKYLTLFLFSICLHRAHSAPALMTRVGVVVKRRKEGDRTLEAPPLAAPAATPA